MWEELNCYEFRLKMSTVPNEKEVRKITNVVQNRSSQNFPNLPKLLQSFGFPMYHPRFAEYKIDILNKILKFISFHCWILAFLYEWSGTRNPSLWSSVENKKIHRYSCFIHYPKINNTFCLYLFRCDRPWLKTSGRVSKTNKNEGNQELTVV